MAYMTMFLLMSLTFLAPYRIVLVSAQSDRSDLVITEPETSSTVISTTASHPTSASTLTETSTTASSTTTTTTTPFMIRTRRTTLPWLPQGFATGQIASTTEASESVTHFENMTTTAPKATGSGSELTLKACCGNQCTTFDNLMSMVGLQCCGESPMNAFEKICCKNQIHLRHAGAKYFDRCCGDRPYAWDQVCCRGKVYDGVPQASCCGDVPYSIYDRTSICCGDQLHKIPPNTGSAVCCGESMYDDRAGTHFCCGDHLYSRLTHNGCCHPYPGVGVEFPVPNTLINPPPPPPPPLNQRNAPPGLVKFNVQLPPRPLQSVERSVLQKQAEGYNSSTQLCCDRVYERRQYDFCCYVADVNAKQWTPPVPRPYSSKTHCCDGMTVLEMNQTSKACIKR